MTCQDCAPRVHYGQPVKGLRFTHLRHLDASFKPPVGVRYSDGPNARYVITRVTKDLVYYRTPEGKGSGYMLRETWEADYR